MRRVMEWIEGRRGEQRMHFLITDAGFAKSHAVNLSGTKLLAALATLSLVLMLMAAGLYHWVFLKGARERWPVVGTLVRYIGTVEPLVMWRSSIRFIARRLHHRRRDAGASAG